MADEARIITLLKLSRARAMRPLKRSVPIAMLFSSRAALADKDDLHERLLKKHQETTEERLKRNRIKHSPQTTYNIPLGWQ